MYSMCRMLSIFQCYGGNYQHVELSSKPLNYTFPDSPGDIIAIISNSYWDSEAADNLWKDKV